MTFQTFKPKELNLGIAGAYVVFDVGPFDRGSFELIVRDGSPSGFTATAKRGNTETHRVGLPTAVTLADTDLDGDVAMTDEIDFKSARFLSLEITSAESTEIIADVVLNAVVGKP